MLKFFKREITQRNIILLETEKHYPAGGTKSEIHSQRTQQGK